jgi:hypothetical protein
VTAGSHDPREVSRTGLGADERARDDDLSIVPGMEPVPTPRTHRDMAPDPDRYEASQGAVRTGPLDMSQDPDRYDPSHDVAPTLGPLDPARDPDRYLPPGQGQTLTDLLGEGAHEGERDNYQWAIGLLSVFLFIALVSWFFTSVATP